LRTQSPAQHLQAVRWHIHLRAQSRTQPLQRVWRRKPLRAQSRTQPLQRVQRRKYLRAQSRTQPMYRLCRPTLVRTQPRTQPVRGLPEADGCGESSGGNGCGRVGWQYCPRGWSGLRKRGTIWVRVCVCAGTRVFFCSLPVSVCFSYLLPSSPHRSTRLDGRKVERRRVHQFRGLQTPPLPTRTLPPAHHTHSPTSFPQPH